MFIDRRQLLEDVRLLKAEAASLRRRVEYLEAVRSTDKAMVNALYAHFNLFIEEIKPGYAVKEFKR
jgi:hypothetical protein